MRKNIFISFACILLSLVLLLGACGQTDKAPEDSKEEPEVSSDPETSTASDKWLYLNASLPLSYDPAIGLGSVDASIYFNVYDNLVFTDIDGTVIPHVATEWTESDDGLTYTFKIRDDIKFHNGDMLTAEDVAFSMNRALAIGQGFSFLWSPYVEQAEATDTSTVVFTLKKPYGVFVATLTRLSILNEELVLANKTDGSYGEFGDYATDWLLTNDAGSGPYKTDEIDITEFVSCSRFDDYWMEWDNQAPDGFTFMAVNETAVVRTMLSNKELSITDEWQTQDSLQMMADFEGVEISNIYSGAIINLEMNTKKAPTDDVHFRKALAYLFDYDTAVNEIYAGTKRTYGPVSSAYQGHDNTVYQYTFDKDKAIGELAQSKYAENPGEITLNLSYSADVPDTGKLALLLQEAASELGIKIEITATPYATMVANAASVESTPSISIWSPSDSYSEAGAVLNLRYHSSSTGTPLQYEWLLDDDIDAAIEAALGELDRDTRLEMYKQIQHDIVEMCPSIWTLEWPEQRAYRADLFSWPEAEAEVNAPILGRSLYFRTIKFK